MSLLAKGSGNFEAAPIGPQQAVCVFVEDIGSHRSTYKGEEHINHQIVMCFELAAKMTIPEYAGKPFMLSQFYTLSLGKKSNLSKDLESWFGKVIPEETRREGFDLLTLKGRNCTLNVVEKMKADGDTVSAIGGIFPIMAGTPLIKPVNTVPPEWIQKKRLESIEARGENMDQSRVGKDDTSEGFGAPQGDDDLPF